MQGTELWAQRLERERRARKEAETLLESKSYELYLANNALRKLSRVQGIVCVAVERLPGQGLTFALLLPAEVSKSPSRATAVAVEAEASLSAGQGQPSHERSYV